MKINRRNFIQTAGTAALATALMSSSGDVFGQALLNGDLFMVPGESFTDPINYLSAKHFEPFTGSVMHASVNGGPKTGLRLLEVVELRLENNEKRGFTGESFSLLFEPVNKVRLESQAYRIEHDGLGEFSLLIGPVGMTGNRYEAVVNRISR